MDDFDKFKEEEFKAAFKNMHTSIPELHVVSEQENGAGNVFSPAARSIPGILPC